MEGVPAPPPELDQNGSEARGESVGAGGDQKEERASEGLVPADVWEELRALAQGRPRAERATEPEPEPESRVILEAPSPPSRERVSEQRALLPTEPGPRSGAGSASREIYRTKLPVPGRAWGEEADAARVPPPPLSTGVIGEAAALGRQETVGGTAPAALLELVRGMSATDLRRAVLFHEVLGPPVSERDEDPLGGL